MVTHWGSTSAELLKDGCLLAFSGPDHRAAAVVVGDHAQVPVSLAVGDLIDPDPVDLLQAGVVELVGHDRVTMLATASQEQRDNLPAPEIIAHEIVEDLTAALVELEAVAAALEASSAAE